ncbi:uncharacterized protein LOC125028147 isoform X2 [Penaeus chinensis]|uniref:uncharacterized protein LOC125028147 isoform X2 n=1 Tax=Penaeus chinensis TaxID=139456 RepID=UPI001FB5CC6E|nr:uncharacterized protein LOC125028147 isoform X2 [Penaeus chinensis]
MSLRKRRTEQTFAMAANSITVQWNAHYSALLHLLKNARREGWYCDATVLCNGKYYSVHKFVLAACSDYFEEMFDKINGKHPMIVMTDMKTARLEALLSYMYEGEVDIMQEDLAGFMETAEAWKVKGLSSSSDEQEQTEGGRRGQNAPTERPIPMPGMDQGQEYNKRRMALNNDWQKAKRMKYTEMIRDLPPISVTEEPFSQNTCRELGHNPIPSIVPGSAVSLSASMKACNAAAEVKKNADPNRSPGGVQAQRRGESQNCVDDVGSDVSAEDIMVVDWKLEPGEVVENFGTYQAAPFATPSTRYSLDTPSNNDCVQNGSSDYHQVRGRRKSKTGGDKSNTQIQVTPLSSVQRECVELRDIQQLQGAAKLPKAQRKYTKDNASSVVSSQPDTPKRAASKGKRKTEGPKQNLLTGGKRKYTRKNTKVKQTSPIGGSRPDMGKEAMPKRKVGRPRKIIQSPVSNDESTPSSVMSKQTDEIQSTRVGEGESISSPPNSKQVKDQNLYPQSYKENEKSLPPEVLQLETVAPFMSLQCRKENSFTPPVTLEPPPEQNTNRSQSSAKRLAASKRRTSLLRQFRKEAPVVPENSQPSSEEEQNKKSQSATQVAGKVPWINRKKRIPNSRRWSKPKKNKSYKKKLRRGRAKKSGSDKTEPPPKKTTLGSTCSDTESSRQEKLVAQGAVPSAEVAEIGNHENTSLSLEEGEVPKEGNNEHQKILRDDEVDIGLETEDSKLIHSPVLFRLSSPTPEREKLHCSQLSTSNHNDSIGNTQKISEI